MAQESLLTREGLLEMLVEHSERIFKEDGRLDAVFFAVNSKREMMIIATPWHNETEKVVILGMVKKMFAEQGVFVYGQVSEVWIKKLEAHQIADRRMPSEYEDREERVMILAVDHEGVTMVNREIIRPYDGSAPSLGPVEKVPYDNMGGRMAELLPQAAAPPIRETVN